MVERVRVGQSQVAAELHAFVEKEVLPGLDLASVFDFGLGAPWLTTFEAAGGGADIGRLDRALHLQSSMIGYLNSFHLLTLAPLAAAPLAFLFVSRRTNAIAASRQS
ncbi:MAG: hypothetical protein F4X35_03995 [Alphaproteobacteria bacterium]|nr:hypothetical protein [Alphaproteobacteria bacterium]